MTQFHVGPDFLYPPFKVSKKFKNVMYNLKSLYI